MAFIISRGIFYNSGKNVYFNINKNCKLINRPVLVTSGNIRQYSFYINGLYNIKRVIYSIQKTFQNVGSSLDNGILMSNQSPILLTETLNTKRNVYLSKPIIDIDTLLRRTRATVKQKNTDSKLKYCEETDERISQLLLQNKIYDAIKYFSKSKDNKLYPSFLTLKKIVKEASLIGDLKCIENVQFISQNCYQVEYNQHSKFEEYRATALFYDGCYKESFQLLLKLCKTHISNKQQLRILRNNINMLMNKVAHVNNGQLDIYAEQFAKTLKSEFRMSSPLASLWKGAIQSIHIHYHQYADRLLEENVYLQKHIPNKIPSLINEAVTNSDKDLLTRLIKVLMKLQLDDYVTIATSALLTVNCK